MSGIKERFDDWSSNEYATVRDKRKYFDKKWNTSQPEANHRPGWGNDEYDFHKPRWMKDRHTRYSYDDDDDYETPKMNLKKIVMYLLIAFLIYTIVMMMTKKR